MPLIRAVVTLPKLTGFPEDSAQNVWHFEDPADTALFDDLALRIGDFYGTDTAGTNTAVGDLISPTVSRATNACKIEFYEVPAVEGPIGAPVASSSFTLPALITGVIPMPDEMALCLSFHGNTAAVPESVPGGAPGPAGDTKPRARRRGRIYIGPLSSAAFLMAANQTTPVLIGSAARTDVAAAAVRLANDAVDDGWIWKVFSRTSWTDHTVEGGWVDNAPDIQRRRGIAPTARTTWTA